VTNCLATVAPELAMDWHPTKNGKLTPNDVTKGHARAVWWRCGEGPDHEWRTRVYVRTSGNSGCPFCAGKRASVTNRLSTVAPALATQWHPTKNGKLTADDVVMGSARRVWWQCPNGPDHVWETPIAARTKHGCPYCVNMRTSVTNCLSAVAPDVALQWHPTKNGSTTPDDVRAGSRQLAWWRCPEQPLHVWQARIGRRVRSGTGCPYCSGLRVSVTNCLAARSPVIAAEWHPTKNGKLTPRDVTPGSNRKVFWRCERDPGHEWQAMINKRKYTGCPHCANQVMGPHRLLANADPVLAAMWHPTKNGDLTPFDVMPYSLRKVWWKCPRGPDHEWECSLAGRSRGKKQCPFCVGWRVSVTNSLATLYPALALQWHPARNGSLSPSQVHGRSTKQVWWLCSAGHAWRTGVCHRSVEKTGCPLCRYRKPRQPLTGKRRRKVWLPGDWK
jgi:hypothetical protein